MDRSQRGEIMKNKRNYLIIPINNLRLKADTSFNTSSIFKKNNVCLKHHYIILKISDFDLANNGYAYELLTNEPFKCDSSIIKTMLDPNPLKEITLESDLMVINIVPKLVSLNEVKKLYKEIILYDEARNYKKSVNEILLNNKENHYVKIRKIN